MEGRQEEQMSLEIAEIERLIEEFKAKFLEGTGNAEQFMKISDIEMLWSELQGKTNNIYSGMIRKLMSEVDESGLISKKKEPIEP